MAQSKFVFTCGIHNLNIVDKYTYLGIILDEHLTYEHCLKSHYSSGSRALSSIISKYNVFNNFTYDMYLQLYDTCVAPIMLYGAETFGYLKVSQFETIQKRALRFFMGVHK